MSEKTKVIVIGAGAAGLFAAYLLAKNGYDVTILEARGRTGGRMNTISGKNFSRPVDLGAEFIHGEATETFELCKAAGIEYYEITGGFWRYEHGRLSEAEEFVENAEMLEKKLTSVKTEMPLADFLTECLPADSKLRKTLTEYVEGYDLADIHRASTFAFKEEWLGDGNEKQYRLKDGYERVISYIEKECRKEGVNIILSSPVQLVEWESNKVVISSRELNYFSEKLIVTVPIGILQLPPTHAEAIHFRPEAFSQELIHEFGFGSVVKVLMEFDSPFWMNDQAIRQSIPELSFLFSNETIPTWWTHYPERNGVLTGWLAQPRRKGANNITRDDWMNESLSALAKIFGCPMDYLSNKLIAFEWCDWLNEPYSRGAYSYVTVTTKHAREKLNRDIQNTLFFAGEALVSEGETGTVEAAFKSARFVAEKIIANDRIS